MEFLVTSLREVDWASFRINFFLLVEPGVMEGAGLAPRRRKLPAEKERGLQARVVEAFPNVGVRVRPLLERVASTLGRIALAVRLLGFTILTGIAILAGAVAASSMRRGGEPRCSRRSASPAAAALLFSVEFGLLGLVAGLLGGLGALLLSWSSSPSGSTWASPTWRPSRGGARHGGPRDPRRPRVQRGPSARRRWPRYDADARPRRGRGRRGRARTRRPPSVRGAAPGEAGATAAPRE